MAEQKQQQQQQQQKMTKAQVDADVARMLAEADKFAAEANYARAEANKVNVDAAFSHENTLHMQTLRHGQEAQTRQILRLEQEQLAHARFHNIYHFTAPVGPTAVANCMMQLDIWHRAAERSDIEIIFSSPGGSVIDGMMLFDYIKQMEAAGHDITTSSLGYAASMAGILLQAGTKRYMGRESYLLLHQIGFETSGSYGQVEDEVKFMSKIQERILDIFASRSKMTRAEIKKGWERKDWWLDSNEALASGFIDDIK